MYSARLNIIAFLFILLLSQAFSCVAAQSRTTPLEKVTLTYCIDPNWAPYEHFNNGKHAGISSYYLPIIAKHANMDFQLIHTVTWDETLQFLAEGKCDFTPFINQSDERKKTMVFSNTYFRAPNVLYAHVETPLLGGFKGITSERVGLVRGYRMNDYLNKYFPNINIVNVASEEDGLKKLNRGKIDLFVGSFYASNLLIQKKGLINIRIVGIAEQEDQLRFGVNPEKQHYLSRINEAISQITEAEHRSIYGKIRPVELVKQMDYTLAIQIGAVMLVVVFVIAFRFYESLRFSKKLQEHNTTLECLRRKLENQNTLLAELSIRDNLTGLFNRAHLSEETAKNIKLHNRYKTPCALILIDIDDFKTVNDTHGHHIGDLVIQHITACLTDCARETDIVARWGGEEFVVLCPETSIENANQLAERFQANLASKVISPVGNITCSIGIAALAEHHNEPEWFIDADKALYQAKEQGKNCICIFAY